LNNEISVLLQWGLDLEILQTKGFIIGGKVSFSIKRTYKKTIRGNGYWSNNWVTKGIHYSHSKSSARGGPTSGCRRHGQGSKRKHRIAIIDFLLK
jgi:hypothetical protein